MIPIAAFVTARLPRIIFGAGSIAKVPAEALAFGNRALIVTGERSFRAGPHWEPLLEGLAQAGIGWQDLAIAGEPSPETIDAAVDRFRGQGITVVIGIGGGSTLDAAKAIAGLLPHRHSVLEHLEGIGPERPYPGPSLPLIAVPTTAGTGSEATKNAVLSRIGRDGFKKSFRDEALIARAAIVDPDLLASCPQEIIAANGMDAFTQLLESYTSTKANVLTDALAWSGLQAFTESFFSAWAGDDRAAAGRSGLAYAALVSGICLAQTGLGAVHGLASPLGAYFPIPHGVCCGTLVAAATDVNIRALQDRQPDSAALAKYAAVGELIAGASGLGQSGGVQALIETLQTWTDRLALPRLAAFGVAREDVERLVAGSRGSSMRTNPLVLTDEEVGTIIMARL
ncbi:MAG: iron-containing alcohol dehydrogenase [Defluviicoccus sp.]|nr:iron-containing alcohol dehydrogenase [Defluviicoccus sp.]MDG4593635.1 iron-containing alcohol dehydrogenase [Defluviicoccus sp.]